MFHPTVFDNVKYAFENQIYDLDNLDGIIEVTDRADLLDLALMSREFRVSFKLKDSEKVTSQVVLLSSIKDLGDEILEVPGASPGCTLLLRFYMEVEDESDQCEDIQNTLFAIWGPDLQPIQTLSFIYEQEQETCNNTIELKFKRQINEDQMEDIPELLKHMIQSAEELETL
ncbi:hypothetical protein [Paenibacillus wynnii]|uniref:Group-specific protein n=1 Tax=Paenibacillus wynnii TaxID=268407 RepID=A0A098M8V4_9BACL|nr:hypothetical protein [Paenibacillus wynnii]KGE18974.1 hypothetical protein PWYN_06130 [Paenibacillus wynnii]